MFMVIAGIGALASAGLAFPTGWMFGFGYGHGVRSGYHAFRPSKNSVTKDLHLSPNPIQGAKGAGMLSAEERTGQTIQGIPVGEPSIKQEQAKLETTSNSGTLRNRWGKIVPRKYITTHEEMIDFTKNNKYPQGYLSTSEYKSKVRYRQGSKNINKSRYYIR